MQILTKDFLYIFEEILDQVAMLFLAGHETTASSLTWTLYILSMTPECQEKVYKEIQEIAKMNYLQFII